MKNLERTLTRAVARAVAPPAICIGVLVGVAIMLGAVAWALAAGARISDSSCPDLKACGWERINFNGSRQWLVGPSWNNGEWGAIGHTESAKNRFNNKVVRLRDPAIGPLRPGPLAYTTCIGPGGKIANSPAGVNFTRLKINTGGCS